MKGWLLVVFMGLVGAVEAGEWGVQFHLGSKHYVSGDYNEFNPGIGYVYRHHNVVLGAGGYRNSFSKDTYYIGAGRQFSSGITIMAVYATGYDGKTEGPVNAVIQYRQGQVLLTLLPGAVGIGLEF